MRILTLIIGLIGVVIAFFVNLFYSSFHVLGRVAGITNDQTHFFWLAVCPVYALCWNGAAAGVWHRVFLYRGLVGAPGIPFPAGCSLPGLQAKQSIASGDESESTEGCQIARLQQPPWDVVIADGDMCKQEHNGQGLYISPGKNLVIVWFSTMDGNSDITNFSRLIAKSYS